MSVSCTHCGLVIGKNKEAVNCDICYNDRNTIYHLSCIPSHNLQFNHSNGKWYRQRGTIWRKLEDQRLKMIRNGYLTMLIRNRKPTKKDEREYEFEYQLPVGNPNLLPSRPKEYIK